MEQFPQKFIGYSGFEDETVAIDRVIRRSASDLVVEFSTEGWLYTVNLKSSDGVHYSGSYSARKANKTESGSASADLFRAGNKQLLFGRWYEGGNYFWWVNLEEVKDFS